jgi:hypothetical protein
MVGEPERNMVTKARKSRNAERGEGSARKPLGSRIRARFAKIGLDENLPELCDETARPATFER